MIEFVFKHLRWVNSSRSIIYEYKKCSLSPHTFFRPGVDYSEFLHLSDDEVIKLFIETAQEALPKWKIKGMKMFGDVHYILIPPGFDEELIVDFSSAYDRYITCEDVEMKAEIWEEVLWEALEGYDLVRGLQEHRLRHNNMWTIALFNKVFAMRLKAGEGLARKFTRPVEISADELAKLAEERDVPESIYWELNDVWLKGIYIDKVLLGKYFDFYAMRVVADMDVAQVEFILRGNIPKEFTGSLDEQTVKDILFLGSLENVKDVVMHSRIIREIYSKYYHHKRELLRLKWLVDTYNFIDLLEAEVKGNVCSQYLTDGMLAAIEDFPEDPCVLMYGPHAELHKVTVALALLAHAYPVMADIDSGGALIFIVPDFPDEEALWRILDLSFPLCIYEFLADDYFPDVVEYSPPASRCLAINYADEHYKFLVGKLCIAFMFKMLGLI